jgi:hypothetical protein
MAAERLIITGRIAWRLETAGRLDAEGSAANLVTAVGDQMYADRGAGVGSAPPVPTGMKLGTDSTAAAKTGAGAALGAYLADSHQALDAGYPSSALSGSSRVVTYRAVWAAGKATSAAPITEIVLVNETLANGTSVASATTARAVLSGGSVIPVKTSSQTLTVAWTHTFG